MKIAAPMLVLPLLFATLLAAPLFAPAPLKSPAAKHATAELVSARINAALEGKAYTLPRD